MALVTSQQITQYYNIFKETEVTFTKQVIVATGLKPREIFLKCLGKQWNCILYSSSMNSARVIISLNKEGFEIIRKANNMVSLRLCFQQTEKEDPISFFVTAKVTGFNLYNKNKPDLFFINLQYTQRPPDDLIEILGSLVEANVNAKKRKEERILLTPDSMRKLGFKTKEAQIFIEGVPRKAIIRDLSFSGIKIIIMGVAKFLVDKKATIKLTLEEKNKILNLNGQVIRYEPVEGRKDIAALAIKFDEETVPIDYKLKINEYLNLKRKTMV